MKLLRLFLLSFLFLFIQSFAQENSSRKNDEKKHIQSSIKPDKTTAVNDKIIFKDGSNMLLEINSEGTTGSIVLPPLSSITSNTNKIYNMSGTLYFNGSALGSGGATQIDDLSDASNDGSSIFIGDYSGINDDSTTNNNTGLGIGALYLNTSGYNNTAIGYSSLFSNTTGYFNTANGYYSLYNNTSGHGNTANGYNALNSNTVGDYNTANGSSALYSNTTGRYNTANGYIALYFNTTGDNNTANGYAALYSNTTGSNNTANGRNALYSNTEGNRNTANGRNALYLNTTGSNNSANGYRSLYLNKMGFGNTANGHNALYSNTTGFWNTANGIQSLYYNTTGSYNTAIGYYAGPSSGNSNLTNTTCIGNGATVSADNSIRLGNSSVTSITGQVAFTSTSDRRFKFNVSEDVAGLDFVMGLRPVSYNMDINRLAEARGEDMRIDENGNRVEEQPAQEIIQAREERTNTRQTGFIAQEVEELVNNLGVDFDGVDAPKNDNGIYGLRYAEFVVPLVKAMQEQQEMIEELQNQIKELNQRLAKN